MASARPIVAPDPPIQMNHWKKGSAAIAGSAVQATPAAAASVFISNSTNQIGRANVPTIDTP